MITLRTVLIIAAVTLQVLLFQNCSPFSAVQNATSASSFGALVASKCDPLDKGKLEMHRLSNIEYSYTIKDLFNVTLTSADFPSADRAGVSGFSNDYARFNKDGELVDEVLQGYFQLAGEVANKIMTQNPSSVVGLGCTSTTDACYDEIVNALALRLFRRPLGSVSGDVAVATYRNIIKLEAAKNDGLKLLLKAMLSSPNYIYRASTSAPSKTLTTYELATRLSYFLWLSTPDVELLNSNLRSEVVLSTQIDRMLASPKAARLANDFGNEWMKYQSIQQSELPTVFGVDQALRDLSSTETGTFLNHIFTSSPRLLDIYDANYSFLNQNLASFYGVSGVTGPAFRKVPGMSAVKRTGLMGQMSILASTSAGDVDTHPVIRGLWVAKEVMCITIKDPPAGTDTDPDLPQARNPTEFARYHATQDSCKSCHAVMDPIGLGLENFNSVGQWRTGYDISPKWAGKNISVEPNGSFNGKDFSSPSELAKIIAADPRTHRCLSEKVMTFAVGRKLAGEDFCASERIADDVVGKGLSFKELVTRIVRSEPFSRGKE